MRLVFDIGGTMMKLALSRDGHRLDKVHRVATPKDFYTGVSALALAARELSGGERITVAAGGLAGVFNKEKTIAVRAPNLSGWTGKPLKEELEKALGAPVLLENDAALAGLGEATLGAGKGYQIVAYLTVSTGVGGARIVEGRIDRNRFGFEPGHQVIDIGGSACEVCNVEGEHIDGPGHLEGYISGTALERRLGQKPEAIVNPVVWDELARFLAYGLNNTILHWSPDVVVLGGSMIVRPIGIKVERVREHLKKILTMFPEHPEIKEAALGDLGGLHGALALLRERGKM